MGASSNSINMDTVKSASAKISGEGMIETFHNDDEALAVVDNGVVVKIQDITKQTRFLIWGAGGDPKEANVSLETRPVRRVRTNVLSLCKSVGQTDPSSTQDQIQEMRETITKLNVALLAKTDKERTLEEKMLRLIENHDRIVRRCGWN
ncbi:hypothetical protein JHK87_050594 [Glycine soja]|nr:hypothetical protein JHK87_050594 [Glycine soja]